MQLRTAHSVLCVAFAAIGDPDLWTPRGSVDAEGHTVPTNDPRVAKRSSSAALLSTVKRATPAAYEGARNALIHAYREFEGNITDETLTYDQVVLKWAEAFKATQMGVPA